AVGDTLDALQRVAHVDVDVVAHERRVVAAVLGVDGGSEHEVAGALDHGDSGLLHLGGQASHGDVDAVLDVHRGQVRVAGQVEGGEDLAGAVVAAAGAEVLQA